MNTIVVGYDGSEPAKAAVHYAVRNAHGRRIVVVHAYDEAPPQLSERWRELLEHDHADRARAVLDEILLESNDELAGVEWEARLEAGSPAEALCNVAREVDAETIVVGAQGEGRVKALLGSVTHDLVRMADRPVTVIPRAASEAARSAQAS